MYSKLLVLGCVLFSLSSMNVKCAFDEDLAYNQLWYASAAYCPRDTFQTRAWVGETEGFVCTKVLYDALNDVTGYVGYNSQDQTIQVTMRGTDSFRNQLVDAQFLEIDPEWRGCDSCMVHKGFYDGEATIRDDMLAEVNALTQKYPDYHLRVAGHSLGAALATLVAVDIVMDNSAHVPSLYTFGQPRVGNDAFADFVEGLFKGEDGEGSMYRVTHQNDRYPHLPPTFEGFSSLNYKHPATECWQQDNSDGTYTIKVCDGSGEDPTCMLSVPLSETNTADHYFYMNMFIDCEAVSETSQKSLRG